MLAHPWTQDHDYSSLPHHQPAQDSDMFLVDRFSSPSSPQSTAPRLTDLAYPATDFPSSFQSPPSPEQMTSPEALACSTVAELTQLHTPVWPEGWGEAPEQDILSSAMAALSDMSDMLDMSGPQDCDGLDYSYSQVQGQLQPSPSPPVEHYSYGPSSPTGYYSPSAPLMEYSYVNYSHQDSAYSAPKTSSPPSPREALLPPYPCPGQSCPVEYPYTCQPLANITRYSTPAILHRTHSGKTGSPLPLAGPRGLSVWPPQPWSHPHLPFHHNLLFMPGLREPQCTKLVTHTQSAYHTLWNFFRYYICILFSTFFPGFSIC